jgi:hypothetical protein
MAGDWHEAIAKLILDNPGVAWELYEIGRARAAPVCTDPWHSSDSGGRRVVVAGGMTVSAETRAESIGAPIFKERRTDRTVKLGFRDGSEMIVVCEVQSVWTDEKALRLPGYIARVHEDYAVPVELVMICKSDGLAARYRKGLWLGEHSVMTPSAVGPADLPLLTDPEAFGQSLQMSVLTMLVRGNPKERDELAKQMTALQDRLDAADALQASDYAYYLSRINGKDLMVVMAETVNREAEPEWWRLAKARMLGEGRADALAEGREEGREEGRVEARNEALRRQRATLLSLLNGLSIPTGYEAIGRIEACDDPDQLAAWTAAVIRIRDADELFEQD